MVSRVAAIMKTAYTRKQSTTAFIRLRLSLQICNRKEWIKVKVQDILYIAKRKCHYPQNVSEKK
jgi:hypothetical protein